MTTRDFQTPRRNGRSPVLWIASGLLVLFAQAALVHLVAYWILLTGRTWPTRHYVELLVVFVLASAIGNLVVATGLARLLRRVFGIWRIGAWVWSLASLWTGFWPLAALFPAARRLGNRPATHFAAWSSAALLLAAAAGLVMRFTNVPLFWPILLTHYLKTGFLLASLHRLDTGTKPSPYGAFALAFIATISLVTQPMWHAPRVMREADAARDALLAAIGSTVRPGTIFPSRPPVAEADDPVSALDKDAIESDTSSFEELQAQLHMTEYSQRRHPLTEEEIALVANWFAAHTNLAAAADAVSSSPDYRSCLPAPESFKEAFASGHMTAEPRAGDGQVLTYANLILLRARAALATGDAAAGSDALVRLENLAALSDSEPTLIGFLTSQKLFDMEIRLLATRIDLWNDEALRAAVCVADNVVALAEPRFRDTLARKVLFADEFFEFLKGKVTEGKKIAFGSDYPPPNLLPLRKVNGSLDYWIAAERRAYFRYLFATWEQLGPILAASANDPVSDALENLEKEERRRRMTLPPLSRTTATTLGDVAESVVAIRTRAAFVHAAVAIEHYRRVHGELPISLDVLVPDFLPVIPRDARTGKPLRYDPGPLSITEENFYSSDYRHTFPAQTFSGFCLALPDSSGWSKPDSAYDFFTKETCRSLPKY